jgi:hypothetical protein
VTAEWLARSLLPQPRAQITWRRGSWRDGMRPAPLGGGRAGRRAETDEAVVKHRRDDVKVLAAVVQLAGGERWLHDAVVGHCGTFLSAHMVPDVIGRVGELPRGPLGEGRYRAALGLDDIDRRGRSRSGLRGNRHERLPLPVDVSYKDGNRSVLSWDAICWSHRVGISRLAGGPAPRLVT